MAAQQGARADARVPLILPVLFRRRGPAPQRPGLGWTRNLSAGGLCVELAERLPPGTALEVTLQTARGPIAAEAEILWAASPEAAGGGFPHGVRFTYLALPARQILRELLRSARAPLRHAGVRLPSELPLTYQRPGGSGPPRTGSAGMVSRGGLLLRLPERLPRGTGLRVTLRVAGELITTEGTIVWVEPSAARPPGASIQHGFRFTALG